MEQHHNNLHYIRLLITLSTDDEIWLTNIKVDITASLSIIIVCWLRADDTAREAKQNRSLYYLREISTNEISIR